MAINVLPTGPHVKTLHSSTSHTTYSYFSGELVTTDSFEGNILDFGAGLSEIHIVNAGSNPIAFQFPECYITTDPATAANTASGIVLPNDKISFLRANKRGLKIRSATTGAQSTKVYVFGI